MLTNLRLRIINFIKKYKWRFILFLIFWAVLIVAGQILQNTKNETPITTFDAFKPIISNGETTPQKWEQVIEETIDEYIGYCNAKEYEKAYNMISEGCRAAIYPTLDSFKGYVDYVFSQKRLYTIKNYSNRGNTYIYRLRLFEDIMATGLSSSNSFKYFEEKISFVEKDGKLLMGLKEYIGEETENSRYDDQYMKITINSKTMKYEDEIYSIRFQNKTEYTIVISDSLTEGEIQLVTDGGNIDVNIDQYWENVILPPKCDMVIPISFKKFYDKGIDSTGIKLNNVRVLRSYSGEEDKKEEEIANAIQIFSTTIPVK